MPDDLPPPPYAVEPHACGWCVRDALGRMFITTTDEAVARGVQQLPALLGIPATRLSTGVTTTVLTGFSAIVRGLPHESVRE